VFAAVLQCAFFDPVNVKQAFGKEPRSVRLHKRVEVTKRGKHQAPHRTVDCDVIRHAVGFARGAAVRQLKDCALTHKVSGCGIFVEVCEDGSKRLARAQLLGGFGILASL
jgi:hypothetical protein